ncbi:universal stress protein [Halobellus clavatus]|jgi:nucleotide-binding universal stress UspA family protein|uniref:Nucleotide-binding universal stress protein, UspA family n=1 Tax=Halobellus clavatus TaxID=660517 RepID=A0A1H3GFG3_9EURY|nr:universal stress protein [Halobellus clavatus]SDY01388.1 Nucleotide-binding universal stress protein, UspA family [Halobellus clavatus]
MVSRLLVPMDDSEMAENALEYALDVHGDADVTVLTVVGEPSQLMGEATAVAMADDPRAKAAELAAPVLERAQEIADARGRSIDTVVGLGHPAREIINRADEYDTVVLGSHGGTIAERLVVGNVAKTVFNRSPVPVTVVR